MSSHSMAGRLRWPGWGAVWFLLAAGASALALALAGSAAALPSNCTQSGATVTCTYSPGPEGTFVVPPGVTSVHVQPSAAGAVGRLAEPVDRELR